MFQNLRNYSERAHGLLVHNQSIFLSLDSNSTEYLTPVILVYKVKQSSKLVYDLLRSSAEILSSTSDSKIVPFSNPDFLKTLRDVRKDYLDSLLISDDDSKEFWTDLIVDSLKKIRHYENRNFSYLGVYAGDVSDVLGFDKRNLCKSDFFKSSNLDLHVRMRLKYGKLPSNYDLEFLLDSGVVSSDTLNFLSGSPFAMRTNFELMDFLTFVSENYGTRKKLGKILDLTSELTKIDAIEVLNNLP